MKKSVIFTVFLLLAVLSFADDVIDVPSRDVFIEGSAVVQSHRTYFMDNFRMEAAALGFNVVNNRADAGYTFQFDVQRYSDDFDPSIQFIVLITLIYNENDMEIVSFGWPYSDLDQMYEYNQYVFFKAAVLIPGISEEELTALMEQAAATAKPDRRWQNQRVYFRLSFDYPITIYALQPDGLIGNSGVYSGDFDSPTGVASLDHRFIALPGATAGLEFYLIRFIGIEANIRAYMGEPGNNDYYNIAAGAQIKIPLRFNGVVFQPYGAFSYPLNISDVFTKYDPIYSVGGGIQAGVKAGKKGSFFVDVSYMFNLEKVAMKNPYGEELYPNPEEIYYKRFVIGLSAGYKIGFFGRKQ